MIDLGLGEFSKWLAATEVSHLIQTTTWIIPTLQIIHILCVAAVFSVAILLTAGLQRSLSSSPNFWDRDRRRRMAGRFAATVSILVWCGILFAGRWIAYTQ